MDLETWYFDAEKCMLNENLHHFDSLKDVP